ncbi:UNVERIFIED_CONTAM: hypothetical protein PYX00_009329 [Menopon gallinae]|uniref:Uncharacterized protein n=1 Tax=Menopon gallinae TaxID=328185 RepID=A0AAW2HAY1_9NEOP
MDESIRNAEKLIDATNSALARMKINSPYDDFNFVIGQNKMDQKFGRKSVFQVEDFRDFLGVKEKLTDFHEIFSLGRGSPTPERNIEHINRKIESYRQELHDREERESLRALYFERNESVASKSPDRSVPATKTASDTNVSQKTGSKIKPITVTENLKSKLLQTQEVVDRGIQTARELSYTVDELRHRPTKIDRYDELSLIKCKSTERLGKSESRSTIKTVLPKRCKKCNCRIGTKKETKQKVQKNEDNFRILTVRGTDEAPRKFKKLGLQSLPSLSIHGDLKYQKIPSVNILPEKKQNVPVRVNTALETFSHEENLRNKIESISDHIIKSDSVVNLGVKGSKSVQCTNCGKLVTLRGEIINAKQIDDLLKMCDYNVFDPRIDEFAERCRVRVDEEAKCTQTEEEGPEVIIAPEVKRPKPKLTKEKLEPESDPVLERTLSIKELSFDVTKKYRQKAAELESDHLHFESILRDLFMKVDESRNLFKNCDYLNGNVSEEKRKSSLSATTPLLLSYTGSGEEVDDGKNVVLRPTRIHRSKLPAKEIRKKLEKRELNTNCKLLSSSHQVKDKEKTEEIAKVDSRVTEQGDIHLIPVRVSSEQEESEKSKKELANRRKISRENNKPLSIAGQVSKSEPKPAPAVVKKEEQKPVPEEPPKPEEIKPAPKPVPTPPEKSSSPINVNLEALEESVKHTTTGSDYESDFEEESVEEQSASPKKDDNSRQFNTRLSTITEGDSEIDPKVTEVPEESVRTEEPAKESPKDNEEQKPTPESTKRKLSVSSSTSSGDDDTEKLLKRVNRDLKEIAAQELLSAKREETVKNLQQGMTEPLKEVLDELKSQFHRTEILADKLSESIKEVKTAEVRSGRTDLTMVNNLGRMRKEAEKTPPVKQTKEKSGTRVVRQRRTSEGEVLSDSGSDVSLRSSVQKEEVRTMRRRSVSEKTMSATKSGLNSSDKSYSEGEIPEQDIICTERSSPSIGEVINENYSGDSFSEGNSVIKFL